MQEITNNVVIETGYLGVTLGAISLAHGLLLVDAPPRPEDVRSWRSSLLNLGGGVDRLLVDLDAHMDRTLGVKAMECAVAAHEKTAQVFRNRPTAFKAQDVETGAEWEQCNGLGSIRWAPPEITFTNRLIIHWDDQPVIMEHHPGPHPGAIWVMLPESKVCFVGDTVVTGQPPFLANADIPTWLDNLALLLSPDFNEYLVIGGRNGLLSVADIRAQAAYLKRLSGLLEDMAARQVPAEETEKLIPEFLDNMVAPENCPDQYTQRLRWGLYYYYARHFRAAQVEPVED
jgi:glyoxylase-like metal-dependent hydrolase (beta-lactamase superfamily II)